jgi:hypothetical protein
MTNEEMQKAMQFIVEQQAQTAVKLDRLSENVEALATAQNRAEARWTRTEDSIRALLSIAELHEREIFVVSSEIKSLSETTRATDERLNVLINVVERHISEGRNGTP